MNFRRTPVLRPVRGQPTPPNKYFVSALPYNEMETPDGAVRPACQVFAGRLERTPADRIAQKREEAERAFHHG